jgi:hypothetical protein
MILGGEQSRTEGGGNDEAKEVLGKVRVRYVRWKLPYHYLGGTSPEDWKPDSPDLPSGELWHLSDVSQAP